MLKHNQFNIKLSNCSYKEKGYWQMKFFLLLLIFCGYATISHADEMSDALQHFSNKEYQQARQIYSRLADKGNVDAQVHLGEMYWYGDGASIDEKNAEIWFKRAAEQGSVKAKQFLMMINERLKRKSEITYYVSEFNGRDVRLNSLACPRLDIPLISKTNEEIRKISESIDQWLACYNRFVEGVNAALPAGKMIPKDIALLMNEDEMSKAILLMDKTYAIVANDAKETAEEILAQQKKWKSATNEFVIASNRELEIANALFRRQVEEENEKVRVNTIIKPNVNANKK